MGEYTSAAVKRLTAIIYSYCIKLFNTNASLRYIMKEISTVTDIVKIISTLSDHTDFSDLFNQAFPKKSR